MVLEVVVSSMEAFLKRCKNYFSWQKALWLYLFNGIKLTNNPPMYHFHERVIHKDDEDQLLKLRISMIGKQVQGYWDDGGIDICGRGMCIEVEHRAVDEPLSKFVYIIQHHDGDRNRILNAKVIE